MADGTLQKEQKKIRQISKALRISSAMSVEAWGAMPALVPLPNQLVVLEKEGSLEPRKGVLKAKARVAITAGLNRYARPAARRDTARILAGRPFQN